MLAFSSTASLYFKCRQKILFKKWGERESHGRLNVSNIVIKLFTQKRNGHVRRSRSEKLMGGKCLGRRKNVAAKGTTAVQTELDYLVIRRPTLRLNSKVKNVVKKILRLV